MIESMVVLYSVYRSEQSIGMKNSLPYHDDLMGFRRLIIKEVGGKHTAVKEAFKYLLEASFSLEKLLIG